MEREQIDVPEVFRRAMEEYGWGEESDDDPPGTRRTPARGCSAPLLIPLALLFALFLSFNWIVTTYTEWLWFGEVGYQEVWLTQWGIQIASFALFFVVAMAVLLGLWHYARRRSNIARALGIQAQPLIARTTSWFVTGAALLMSFFFASAAASNWEFYLRYINRVPFGREDPIFGRDIGFYIFELPIYGFVQGWGMSLLFIAIVGIVGLYAVGNWAAIQNEPLALLRIPSLRRLLAILGALFFGLWAVGYWLDAFELVNSDHSDLIVGASYTDLNATLLALRVQMVLMVLLALAVAFNAVRANRTLPLAAGGLWLVAGLLLGGLYPSLLQRYAVDPNELAREEPYIEYHIEFTRLGFGLERVRTNSFGTPTELDNADLRDNEDVLRNVRIWDYRPLRETYAQLQELRPYYEFNAVDIDRYVVDGQPRQVMLSARELNKRQLQANSWVNQKLEYTHGYGLVMNPVDVVTSSGRPDFLIRDLPPRSDAGLVLDRPEIYFGELTDDEVFVSSNLPEFNYPSGNQNVYTSYDGQGGVLLSGLLRRLAFAFRFGETSLLLSEYITPETRVLLHRQISERVARISPFLTFDDDPYIVLVDGRLVWMVDAYTTSGRFPYSRPVGVRFGNVGPGTNYIRNSVKVSIDAYDGTVRYYIADPDDPLIRAYARAFPSLFRSIDEMPESLRAHIRYPEDLFQIQAQQYLTFHMTETQVFYNKEDLWDIPDELFEQGDEQPIEPYYVLFRLPGEESAEYLLTLPFVPRGKDNMIAWMAARNDPPNYGELVVYELPKQELVFGPLQIEARIDQDPQISQQISLWSQRGSRVIRGNLIIIPVNDAFLYVEPLYLQAENSPFPELKRVIVASGDRLVMRETLDEALTALIREEVPAAIVEGVEAAPPPVETAEEVATPVAPVGDVTLEALVQSANEHFLAAEAAQRAGDWTTYGRELEALESDLAQLEALVGTP